MLFFLADLSILPTYMAVSEFLSLLLMCLNVGLKYWSRPSCHYP